jgi:hypothetical protein
MYNSLNDEQKDIYNKYKSNDDCYAFNLNNCLRNNEYSELFLASDVSIIDSFFDNNSNCLNQYLYRGTRECLFIPFQKSGIYENPDFLSTSLDMEVAKSFLENVHDPIFLIFKPSKRLKAFDFESNIVFCNDEAEFLVCRKQKFTLEKDTIIEGDLLKSFLKAHPLLKITKLRIVELLVII